MPSATAAAAVAATSSASLLPPTPRRSMEEVWRDITMIPTTSTTTFSSFRGAVFQDFLSGEAPPPMQKNPPPPPPADAVRIPVTALSLNSIPDTTPRRVPAIGFFSLSAEKRALEQLQLHDCRLVIDDEDGSGGGGDRRRQRMMKNRESASRSRARKQAYTNELELEVAHLLKENVKLKTQYEELRMAMEAQANTTKRTLQRTSTALF